MGYYTKFELVTVTPSWEYDRVSNELFEGSSYLSDRKWYTFDKDFAAYSKSNPFLKIEVFGEGEEYPDIWTAYAFGGETAKVKAEITFKVPDFFQKPLDKA